jgi:hypothetical protein
MNVSGRRILKTTAAVVGISALGALGTGTAFAATPTDLGGVPNSHGTSATDAAGLSSPTSSQSGDLHTFAMPKMDTHVAEPTTRYNDNNYNDNSDSGYDHNRNSRYDNNYDNNSDYNDNGYDNNYDNGYYDNGYYHRNNDNGLLGGGLLGGNN